MQADSLPSETAKPKNTGVGVLSLHPLVHPSSVHSWELPNPGIKLGFPALQADSLPTDLSYLFIYLNHFAVQQKLTQHCKSTLLQLKNNNNSEVAFKKDLLAFKVNTFQFKSSDFIFYPKAP